MTARSWLTATTPSRACAMHDHQTQRHRIQAPVHGPVRARQRLAHGGLHGSGRSGRASERRRGPHHAARCVHDPGVRRTWQPKETRRARRFPCGVGRRARGVGQAAGTEPSGCVPGCLCRRQACMQQRVQRQTQGISRCRCDHGGGRSFSRPLLRNGHQLTSPANPRAGARAWARRTQT